MSAGSFSPSRRQFIFKTVGTFVAANTSIYLIGSAFKNLDGSLVAGAKYCCMGRRPTSPPCYGDGIFRIVERDSTVITTAQCNSLAQDVYGTACVQSNVNPSCP